MKTSLLLGGTLAVLGTALASMSAQTQSTTVQVSKLVGTKVKSSQGEEIGVVKDVMIDSSTGCMAYTVLSTGEGGTRGGGGGRLVAVPWAVYSPTSDLNALTVTVDRERIYSAPVFDYARIDEYSRPDYITNVYSHYGVSTGAEIGAGVSRTTTTGVSGGAAAASPGAAASPAATASAAATTSPRPTAGRGSPSPRATAARSQATASPREREREAASPATREEHGRRGRPGETESPSSRSGEERGTSARPGKLNPRVAALNFRENLPGRIGNLRPKQQVPVKEPGKEHQRGLTGSQKGAKRIHLLLTTGRENSNNEI
jgi:sporulation protein YlmC with PRC-barrel domain